jgi:hypothetical protein
MATHIHLKLWHPTRAGMLTRMQKCQPVINHRLAAPCFCAAAEERRHIYTAH